MGSRSGRAVSSIQTATVTFTSDSDSGGDNVASISCTAPSHPNVVVSPATLAFGTRLVGTTSTSQTVTVSNDGNANLTFYFSQSGTDAAMYLVMLSGPGCGSSSLDLCTVPPGSNRTMSVYFAPTSRGVKTASLNINTNDPDAGDNVRSVSMSGTGVAPQVAVSPSPYDYLGVRDNDAAAISTKAQAFTISNASTDTGQTLTISSVMFSGTNAGDFSVTTAGSSSIAPGTGSPWTVTFNPSGAGVRTATMTIATNDPITPNRTVSLTGTGTSAVIAVSDVDFMTVGAGLVGSAPITVSNKASSNVGTLTATSATIAGSTWFSFGTGSGCTAGTTTCTLVGVTAPADKTVPIRCSPPAAASGTATATVTFASDSDAGGDNVAMLTCTAGRPNISVSHTTIDFASVVVGQTSTPPTTVTVTNNGNADLTFWLSESGTDVAMFAESTGQTCGFAAATPCSVPGGTSMGFSVTFSPTSPGAKTATLNINNNDPDAGDGVKTIALTGNGTAGVATANPTSIAFGPIEVGMMSGNTTLTVTNTGMASLTITNAGLVLGAGEFQVASGTIGTQSTVLGPNGSPTDSTTWQLNCRPTSQGMKSGTFRIISNGYATGTVDVALTCTGQQGLLAVSGGSTAANFYDFGAVPQQPSPIPYRDFTLTNSGNVAVNNISVSYDATKLLGFSLVTPTPTLPITSLAPGASVTIRVQFNPQAGTDGCVASMAGDCAFTFTGGWGTTPTNVSASIITIGDGLVQGYDTSPSFPNPLDFGDVRFDQTKDMTFSVLNTSGSGGASVDIRTLSITPGTAMSGEFTVVGCCRGNGCVASAAACPTTASPVALAPLSNPLIVTVRCAPNNRVAMLDATLTVTSSLGGTPNRTVPLRANSTTAGLAVTPSTNVLDFGPTDLDAVPVSVTKKITLQNTGTASLNVGLGVIGGNDVARFAFTSVAARVVAPNATFDIDVTYTPLIEKPSNAPDTASLTFPITGVHMGPASVTIQITGFGADRHIAVGQAPAFPDTFKNPGSQAPILPVTVTNNGDVPLDISAVMLDNGPIWTIENPDPVVVPGRGTHDFMVKFSPVDAGKAPTGHLVIINNDNGMPMVSVDLNGNGIDRRVTFGPPVDLGYVGIGLTARLSDIAPGQLLSVANDSDFEFMITGLTTDDESFRITDLDGNSVADVQMVLMPHSVRQFDVTFSPDRVGDFNANGILYLEGADATYVPLAARGLYADARGGGGCSTTGGTSRGWLVLVLGALLVAGRRRRMRRAVTALAVTGTVLTAAGTASADERDIDLDVFDPIPATVGRTFHVQHANIDSDGSWAASALVTYANTALVIDSSQNEDVAVANRALLTLGGAYAFGGRYEAAARIPLVLQSGDALVDSRMRLSVPPGSGADLADLSLHFKARIGVAPALGGSLAYGASAMLTLPTATGDFGGNELPTARLLALGSLSFTRLSATVNAGGILRGETRFANVNQRSGVAWGGGATYWLLDQLWVTGELFGELIPGGKFDMTGNKVVLNTIEGLVGAQYRPARTMSLGVAIGRGVTSGPGAPALRGIVTFSYTPSAEELGVIHPGRKGPPPDDDVDGVANKTDECPENKEDVDGFRDDDGCPDPDNDQDGVADTDDKCPAAAEDRDRFEDTDGCPDPDNDQDGIEDAKDKCRGAAEDKDGFQDQDGCPETDNDKDGLVDTVDQCPIEPESINGNADDDGCPDKGDSLVVLSPDRIELLEGVQFKGTKLAKGSTNLLGQVGAHLRAHPEIVRVRLAVHVHPSKDAAADQKLSEARAKVVYDFLVEYGIDALRLQSTGFGSKQPLVPPTTKGAQLINDRLEMIVLERK